MHLYIRPHDQTEAALLWLLLALGAVAALCLIDWAIDATKAWQLMRESDRAIKRLTEFDRLQPKGERNK